MNRPKAIRALKAITLIGVYGGLLMPLAFFPVVIFPFVFSKLIFFQVLIGLTFPAYLVLAWCEPQYRPKWNLLYAAIIAYFIAVGLSVIFAVDPLRAWWGNQERMNGLFTVFHFFLWLTMMVAVLKTWDQWKKILIYEVVISAVMASVALLQIPFPKLLLFPASDRVGGLLDNPIYMAAYQIFNFFFIALLWLRGTSRSTKAWLVLFALLDIGAFVAAQSRGALAGLGIGIIVFAVSYAFTLKNRKHKLAIFGAVSVLFLCYGIVFAFQNSAWVQKLDLKRFTDLQGTTQTRIIAWEIAWQSFLERPLTGWGFDNFHILFNAHYNPQSLRFGYYETWFDRAHNTVMDMLSMTGIFGTLTYFAIFGTLFWSVARAKKRGWIDGATASIFIALPTAYFFQNLFVFDQPAGFVMSFFMYGLIIRMTRPPQPAESDAKASETRPFPPIILTILYVAVALIVWRTSVLPWQASAITIQSNNYFSAGMLPEALAFAKQAAAIPTPYLDEQTFLQSRNLISLVDAGTVQKFPQWREWHDLIVSITEKHLSEHGQNTHPHFIYARFLDSFAQIIPEDGPIAEREYLAAIKTSPKRQQLFYSLGRLYLMHGNKDAAYNTFKQAEDFDPGVGESHWYVGLTLTYDQNKQAEGAKELAAALSAISPYALKDAREGLVAAQAYETLKDADGFRKLLTQMQSLGGGSVELYLELARIAERMGLIPERNVVLNAITRADPIMKLRLAPLMDTKTATSIDDSLRKVSGSTPVPAPVTTTPAPTPAPAPTGSGPRK